MRGDSVRDLHAKVLALCGLGLLAGAGALVDYWPVQDPLPGVAARNLAQPQLRPRAVPANSVLTSRFTATRPATVRRRTSEAAPERITVSSTEAATVVPVLSEAAIPIPRAALPVLDTTYVPGERVSLGEAPLPAAPVPVAAMTPPAAAVTALLLNPPPPTPEAETRPPNHRTEEDGLITGALKKTGAVAGAGLARTGDVIARTGAAAGASILDAFRGLAGAVKKVSPFVP